MSDGCSILAVGHARLGMGSMAGFLLLEIASGYPAAAAMPIVDWRCMLA